MRDVSTDIQFVVYQDLNDAGTIIVCRTDEIVSGTFKLVAGPFASREEAEREAKKIMAAH